MASTPTNNNVSDSISLSEFTELKKAYEKVVAQNAELTKQVHTLQEKLKEKNENKRKALLNKNIAENKKLKIILSDKASFTDLSDDVLHKVLEFTNKKSYAVYGLINKQCNAIFDMYKVPKVTFKFGFSSKELIKERLNEELVETDPVLNAIFEYNRTDLVSMFFTTEKGVYIAGMYDSSIFHRAIMYGKVDILKEIFRVASEEEMKYLRKSHHSCSVAAEYGQLEVLKLLRAHGCEWNEHTYYSVEHKLDREHIREYLRENRCPYKDFQTRLEEYHLRQEQEAEQEAEANA